MHPQEIKKLIEEQITSCSAEITGEDGRHFTAVVISPAFGNKNRVQRQQLVYSALGNHISDGTIHAISIKTFTPEEWNNRES